MAPSSIAGRHVLVVDDEPGLRRALARLLGQLELVVDTAADGLEGQRQLRAGRYDLCITDLRMPGADGFAVLGCARTCTPRVPVVVLTGFGTVATAVQAMRGGAANFLSKPASFEELEAVVTEILGASAPSDADAAPSPAHSPAAGRRVGDARAVFVGEDEQVRELLRLVMRVADTDSTVLITGESGTGKEVLARVLHATGSRASGPFVAVNCAAIPEALLESELFGHVRGAFTGAVSARRGRLAQAEGGTLFLDEIGELAPVLQAKLLRVLQEKEYSPVGDAHTHQADVRIVAATNADLEALVAAGRFRQDLLFRLNVIQLEPPPLRRRPGDIPLLIEHLLERITARLRRPVSGCSAEVLRCFARYDWPGNVRELENVLERAVAVRGAGTIELSDLPERVRTASMRRAEPAPGADSGGLLDESETRVMLDALERTNWNKTRAAALLGIKRTTLVEKLKRKGLTRR